MGYILDGILLAGCVGAYRVYTDTRKSVLNSSWDSYRHLFLNMSRHGGDFLASTCIDAWCHYPSSIDKFINSSRPYLSWMPLTLEEFRRGFLTRAARYRVWSQFSHLGYLQRVFRANESSFSLFGSDYAWKRSLLFTSPPMLTYVKDDSTKAYLHALAGIRDSYVGIVEGSQSDIAEFLKLAESRKKDLVQDLRKGHILDRYPESSVGIVHPLRMEIEGFLFASGPDPDRASYVDSVLAKTKNQLEALFPLLECIVDYSSDDQGHDTNVPVIHPLLFVGDRPVGVLTETPSEFMIDPLLWSELGLETLQDVEPGQTVMLGGEPMTVVGMHGKVPTVRRVS